MKKTAFAGFALSCALFCSPAFAQWARVPATPIPRGNDGKPNLSAPAPRFADGKPDLSGIWNAPTGYLRNLAQDLKEEVPFQPWAKALYDERAAGLHWRDDQKRSYPYQTMAAQVVGFSNADDDGKEAR